MTFCYTKMKTVDFSQRLKTIRHLFADKEKVHHIHEILVMLVTTVRVQFFKR